MAAILPAQTKLGPFEFLDHSEAAHFAVGAAVLGGPLALSLSAEVPAPRALQFFDFIPGYAVRYSAIAGDGLFLQGALITRARYQPNRKLVGVLGLGLGLETGRKGPSVHPGLVIGIDYLYSRRYVLSLAAGGLGKLTVGFGIHRGYGW
ncbi:MAG: hypothetical protein V3U35_02660 [Candidatus Neomarinimicrobiota bacterium]